MTKKEYFRKHYKKPQVIRIEMEIEEAVLQACKAAGSAGPLKFSCDHPNTPCEGVGS